MAQASPLAVEDGNELTLQAWHLLEAEAKDLGLPDLKIQPIPDFLQVVEQHRLSFADRQTILDQAILIFDHLYPHMPFKTEIYRFPHPSDYLRLEIQPHLESLSEIDFQMQMITAFSLVRDAHTLYGLPSPYRDAVAFLPFQMRPFLDHKTGWRFIVTSAMNTKSNSGFEHSYFGSGAEIVGWGGLGVLAHVQRTEEHLPGGNFFASLVRGAIHSTLRPLVYVQLPFPDETPAATIHYRPLGGGEVRAISLPWAIGTGFGGVGGFPSSVFSISPATAITSACGKILHHRAEMRDDQKAAQLRDLSQTSTLPGVFDFQYTGGPRQKGFIDLADLKDSDQPNARFGYVRIIAFSDGSSAPGSTDRIVNEFKRIVTLMDEVAPDGLVIDIRSNPGGDVQAAERMLQMLTAQQISPARFHLANTPVILEILLSLKSSMERELSVTDDVKLSSAYAELSAWLDDAEQPPLPEGSRLTSGQPLTDPYSANDIGQIYHGRGVVLLINSLTYSAADIFAAGFQDHGTGALIGTSLVTGGGGANVWSHQDLMHKIGPRPGITLLPLPGDASMSLAIRRCTRVGPFEGQPVEDQGVNADVFYIADSVEDLVAGNPGLLRRACRELSHRGAFRVDVETPTLLDGGGLTVTVRTKNIASLRFYLNGHPALTESLDGDVERVFSVPSIPNVPFPSVLRIEGYSMDPRHHGAQRLMRARTTFLQKPVVAETFDPVTQSITGMDSTGAPSPETT